eukprot:Opistho-1_new@100138
MGRELSRTAQDACVDRWRAACSRDPHGVWAATAALLRGDGSRAADGGLARRAVVTKPPSLDDYVRDPASSLTCADSRALAVPSLLTLLLECASGLLAMSRRRLLRELGTEQGQQANGLARNANVRPGGSDSGMRHALAQLQEAACIHAVIEGCLRAPPPPIDNGGGQRDDGGECRLLASNFVHRLIIQDPSLARVVHAQGYALDAVAAVVAGVPSMHLCIEFAAELLRTPDSNRRRFAAVLCGCLCRRYPIPRALPLATAVSDCVHAMSALEGLDHCDRFAGPLECGVGERTGRAGWSHACYPTNATLGTRTELRFLLDGVVACCEAFSEVVPNTVESLVRMASTLRGAAVAWAREDVLAAVDALYARSVSVNAVVG